MCQHYNDGFEELDGAFSDLFIVAYAQEFEKLALRRFSIHDDDEEFEEVNEEPR